MFSKGQRVVFLRAPFGGVTFLRVARKETPITNVLWGRTKKFTLLDLRATLPPHFAQHRVVQ